METRPDDKAFPVTPSELRYDDRGLTKREYFAIHILQGIVASGKRHENHEKDAINAVLLADELIARLNK